MPAKGLRVWRRNKQRVRSVEDIATAQAMFYVVTGIWPIVHMRSFEWITGPKVDRWLVKTVAGLVTVVGGALGLAASSNRVTPEVRFLAVGTAVALACVDIVYVRHRRIRSVYLLDAAANLSLATAMVVAGTKSNNGNERPFR